MSLSDLSIREFLDELASPSPAPGGGSAAALAGAIGASLVEMVCRLTIGRKNYLDVSAEFESILPQAETKRRELIALMEADASAYSRVITAYKLPKDTPEEQTKREGDIQAALKEAADVPFQITRSCAEVLALAQPLAAKGNKNAASDAGAAALLAEAGMRAAALNVEINLILIKDDGHERDLRERLAAFTQGRSEQKEQIVATVRERM